MARQEVLVRQAEVLAINIAENKKDPEKPYINAYVFTAAGDRPKFYEVRLNSRQEADILSKHERKAPVTMVLDCFTWDKRESYTFLGLLGDFMKAG